MSVVINLMKALGLPTVEDGLCYGIAHAALQANARGELNQFLRRMALVRVCPLDKLVEKIEKSHSSSVVPDVVESYDEIDTEYGDLYDSMHAFLQMILFYHVSVDFVISDPVAAEVYESAKKVMGITYQNYQFYQKFLSPGIKNTESKYTKDEEVKYDPEFTATEDRTFVLHERDGQTVLSLNEERLGEFIAYLNDVRGDIALSFNTATHTFALFKNKKKWIVVNHDIISEIEGYDDKMLSDAIFNGLKTSLTLAHGLAVPAYIESFSSNASLLADFESKQVWMNPEVDLYSVLNMAMRYGCYEIVRAYGSYLNDCFETGELKREALIATLVGNTPAGVPALYMAMQNGHYQAISVYIELLNRLFFKDLINRVGLIEILIAKRPNGFPALFIAIENGHHKAISVYGETLDNLMFIAELSSRESKDILLDKESDGIFALTNHMIHPRPEERSTIDGVILQLLEASGASRLLGRLCSLYKKVVETKNITTHFSATEMKMLEFAIDILNSLFEVAWTGCGTLECEKLFERFDSTFYDKSIKSYDDSIASVFSPVLMGRPFIDFIIQPETGLTFGQFLGLLKEKDAHHPQIGCKLTFEDKSAIILEFASSKAYFDHRQDIVSFLQVHGYELTFDSETGEAIKFFSTKGDSHDCETGAGVGAGAR